MNLEHAQPARTIERGSYKPAPAQQRPDEFCADAGNRSAWPLRLGRIRRSRFLSQPHKSTHPIAMA
eukprot:272234-Pleurochrysis_carterae.AAC.2